MIFPDLVFVGVALGAVAPDLDVQRQQLGRGVVAGCPIPGGIRSGKAGFDVVLAFVTRVLDNRVPAEFRCHQSSPPLYPVCGDEMSWRQRAAARPALSARLVANAPLFIFRVPTS